MIITPEPEFLDLTGKEYNRCFVAYLDILGFKSKVINSDNPEVLESLLRRFFKSLKYYGGVDESKTQQSPPVRFTWNSDSILIYTEDNTLEKFINISSVIAFFIMGTMDYIPFPVRGALSQGDFYCDSVGNIYFGKAMLDAIEWEAKQEWSGVILTPDCSNFVKTKNYHPPPLEMTIYRGDDRHREKVTGPLLVEYDVPIKKEINRSIRGCNLTITREENQKLFCINWTVASRDINESKIRKSFLSLSGKINNYSLEKKILNTYNFYRHCKTFEDKIGI